MRINLWIPHIVINAVQYAAKLALMGVQHWPQTAALIGKARFMGMSRRYGGDEVGIDHPAFH